MEKLNIKEIYFQEKDSFIKEIMYSLSLVELEEKIVVVNDKKVSKLNKLSREKITSKLLKIQKIIQDWDDNYISGNAFDGKIYKIVIIMNDGSVKKIIGKNKFPKGFHDFIQLLSGDLI